MELSTRMKEYERIGASQEKGIQNLPIIIRLDGKNFSGWTKGLNKPYDVRVMTLFDEVTKYLVEQTNSVIGYTQSDEITLILYNYGKYDSQTFFDGRFDKLNSVLASMAAAKFNFLVKDILPEKQNTLGTFDCRCFNVPSELEATNAIYWRVIDAERNSIQIISQSLYSQKELYKKNISLLKEMILAKSGKAWDEESDGFKYGRFFRRNLITRAYTIEEMDILPKWHEARTNKDLLITRKVIEQIKIPSFTDISNRIEVVFCRASPIFIDKT